MFKNVKWISVIERSTWSGDSVASAIPISINGIYEATLLHILVFIEFQKALQMD